MERQHGFLTLKPSESATFKLPVPPAPGRHTSGYVQQMNNYTQATSYVLPPDDSTMRGGKGPGVLILDFGNA